MAASKLNVAMSFTVCLYITPAVTADARARMVRYNVPYEDMHAPVVGKPQYSSSPETVSEHCAC